MWEAKVRTVFIGKAKTLPGSPSELKETKKFKPKTFLKMPRISQRFHMLEISQRPFLTTRLLKSSKSHLIINETK